MQKTAIINLNFQAEIDECLSYPCAHAGTCTDGVYSYTCKCEEGWTDANCTQEVDNCANKDCGDGHCYSLQNSSFCRLVMLHMVGSVTYIQSF